MGTFKKNRRITDPTSMEDFLTECALKGLTNTEIENELQIILDSDRQGHANRYTPENMSDLVKHLPKKLEGVLDKFKSISSSGNARGMEHEVDRYRSGFFSAFMNLNSFLDSLLKSVEEEGLGLNG